MTKPVPCWVQTRYAKLFAICGTRKFDRDEAMLALKGSFFVHASTHNSLVGRIIVELRKADWLTMSIDKKDARLNLYQLREPNVIFEKMEVG